MVVYLALIVLLIASMWKVFSKAGKPGWAAIIPFYNIIVELQIVGRPLWWTVLYFIPVVGFVVSLVVLADLAKSFGKSGGWGVGMLGFLGIIGFPMLAFGSSIYQGTSAGGPGAVPPAAAPTGTLA